MLSPSLGLARPAQIQGEPQNWGGAFSVPRTLRRPCQEPGGRDLSASERTKRTAHFAGRMIVRGSSREDAGTGDIGEEGKAETSESCHLLAARLPDI